MSRVFDVAVIGGGPAGTSAAITAARSGFDVVLVEAGRFPRQKVCGEFVSGEGLKLLLMLLGERELIAQAPRIGKARVLLDDRCLQLPVRPAAASISRFALDAALWRAAQASGVLTREHSRVKGVRREGQFFALELRNEILLARCAINAGGRWSNLRVERPGDGDLWIGIKGHFAETTHSDSCDLYFFCGGYCGVQPLGDEIVNAAAMVRPNVARDLQSVFRLNPALRQRSADWKLVGSPVTTAPIFFRDPQTSHDGVVFVGDAAAFIDPFAGDGISMALHSGQIAGMCLEPYLRGECSLEGALSDYDSKHRTLIQPALRSAARLRKLLHLPKPLRATAMSVLRIPFLARAAVQETRVRAS